MSIRPSQAAVKRVCMQNLESVGSLPVQLQETAIIDDLLYCSEVRVHVDECANVIRVCNANVYLICNYSLRFLVVLGHTLTQNSHL